MIQSYAEPVTTTCPADLVNVETR